MSNGKFYDAFSGRMVTLNLGSLGRGVERRMEAAAIAAGRPKCYPFSVNPPTKGIYCVRSVLTGRDVNDPTEGGTYFSVYDGKHWNGAWGSISEAIDNADWYARNGNQEYIDTWLAIPNEVCLFWRKTISSDPS